MEKFVRWFEGVWWILVSISTTRTLNLIPASSSQQSVCVRVYVCVENIEILYCYSRLILKLRSLILPFDSLFSSFYILWLFRESHACKVQWTLLCNVRVILVLSTLNDQNNRKSCGFSNNFQKECFDGNQILFLYNTTWTSIRISFACF